MFSVGWEGSGRMGRAEGWSRKRLSKKEGAVEGRTLRSVSKAHLGDEEGR